MEQSDLELVEAALVSGTWKQKTDGKGRTFFGNVTTKKSLWKDDFVSFLRAEAAERGSTLENARMERHAKARKRGEEEARLRASIADLERQKAMLEEEVNRLEGPLASGTAVVDELRKKVADAKGVVQVAQTEQLQKRQEKEGELHVWLAKVQALKSIQENEKRHRNAVKERFDQLQVEIQELQKDLLKETNSARSIQDSMVNAQRELEKVQAASLGQQKEVEMKRQQVRSAEEDLEDACKIKVAFQQRVDLLKKENEDMENRMKQKSFAQGSIEANGKKVLQQTDALQRLVQKFEKTKKEVETAKKKSLQLQSAVQLQDQNEQLRHLLNSAKKDKVVLIEVLKRLNKHTVLAHSWTVAHKAHCEQLQADLLGV